MDLDSTFLPVDKIAPKREGPLIQVAGIQNCSYVAGPGRRCVIWVSGCLRRCPGCFQSHFFDFSIGYETHFNELAEQVLSLEGINGITLSGGEPFEQSIPLSSFCEQIKKKSDLSILAYTGYRLSALELNPTFSNLLAHLDILIDGEFREELAGPFLYRGSANQRILFRDEKTKKWKTEKSAPQANGSEIQVALGTEEILITGFPDSRLQKKFETRLASRGIKLKLEKLK